MIDPGDGSGKFHKVESDKSLKIKSSGKIESNGDLSKLSTETGDRTYGKLLKVTNGIILNSHQTELKIYYELKGDSLLVYYPCKEGCAEKYKRKK